MKKLVLFSGGMDSTAALAWASQDGARPEALFVYYGHPAAQHETERAIAATRAMAIPFHRMDLASAYFGGSAQGLYLPVSAGTEGGIDKAFLPLRNPLLITAAAAYAFAHWPGESVELIVGCNATDASGFPDCRRSFLAAVEETLQLALGTFGRVTVTAPWLDRSKAEVIEWVRDHAPRWYTLLFESWSCYRSKGPCGECNACVSRAHAIDTVAAPHAERFEDRPVSI